MLDIALFVILGFALMKLGESWRYRPDAVIGSVVGGMVIGALIVYGFFLF